MIKKILFAAMALIIIALAGTVAYVRVWPALKARTADSRPKETAAPETKSKFGFIRSVRENGRNFLIEIDDAEFLSGEAAIQAGLEDTDCSRKTMADCIPSLNNDFYIRNLERSTDLYNLSKDAAIQIFQSPGSPVLVKVSLSEFVKQYRDPKSRMTSYTFKYALDSATVTSLEEQYTP